MSTSFTDIKKSYSRDFGARCIGNEYTFTVKAHPEHSFSLNLYTLKGESITTVDMLKFGFSADVYSVAVTVPDGFPGFSYDYTCDGETFNDPYMTDHTVIRKYKELADDTNAERAVVKPYAFELGDGGQLKIPFEDIIAYELHVRGFTKHTSSRVRAKGTYRGIIEKIDYLKSLNINQLILMPAYEFYEFDSDTKVRDRLNYWGYKEGYYFCPKAGYSYSKDFTSEFKDMVKALHEAGIEVIMQFYFPASAGARLIDDCLGFWYTHYHVDGFYLMAEQLPLETIYTNPLLLDAKLYIDGIDRHDPLFKKKNTCRFICDSGRGFYYDGRRFLKGDEDSVHKFINTQCFCPDDIFQLNYLTCYEGFTLNDLVSYSNKHNEDNGENNQDGFPDNISWNCGMEGKSNKVAIKDLRLAQMQNAMCLLMLSKAAPMFFMGDEFMNTQYGNNNPYCQDNNITWLNWSENKYNVRLLEFVIMLCKFRKQHPVLRKKVRTLAAGNGFPDISYHQDNAWQYRQDSYLHHVGIMEHDGDDTLYIALNMHWENHLFGLPKLKKGYVWKYMFDTSGHDKGEFIKSLNKDQDNICLYKRSIMVLKAFKEDKNVR